MRKMKMTKAIDYVPWRYKSRVPVKLDTGTETIVEQCHRETHNINKIVGRYHETGMLPPGREGRYEDVSMVGEYHDVLLKMNEALAEYEELPEKIRNRFADAGEFLEFAEQQRIEQSNRDNDSADTPGVSPGQLNAEAESTNQTKPPTEKPPADAADST